VLAAVLRTWWDSRVNFITGAAVPIILTLAYFFLRGARETKT